MPEINNYSFSNAVFNIQEGTVINDQVTNATITISPLPGYTVTASDFNLDPSFSNTYVQGVTFTQSGSDVICTITFLPTVTMPSANVTIPLCIIGQGVVNEITIGGTVTAIVGTDVTGGSSETDTPYSNSGNVGNNELLFTRTYNAATGFAWANNELPSINVTQGNQSNYNIIQTPIFDSQNRLTNITYDVNYIYTSANISGDHIDIVVPKTSLIYNPLPRISGYIFNTTALTNSEETRTLTIVGVPETTFSATLNDGTTTNTIINNEDLDTTGRYVHDITFPALTKGNAAVTYTIELTGSHVSNISLPNPFTVRQLNEVSIEIDVTNPPTPIAGWPTVEPRNTAAALITNPNSDLNDSTGLWVFNINEDITPFSGSGTLSVDKQVELTDFAEAATVLGIVNGDQTSVTTLILDDTTGILAGDRFNYLPGNPNDNNLLAPFGYEVSSVDSGTNLTITPAITIIDNSRLIFTRSNGNVIQVLDSNVTSVNASTINLNFNIAIANYGDTNITFDLDLSNIISYTP